MTDLISIKKTLPGGRVVRRLVSENEFMNQWYKQGWTPNTVHAEDLTKEAQTRIDEQEFKNLTEGKDILTLRGYMSPIKVFKTLPGGKRVYRKLYKGEYDLKGWKDQGWQVTYDTSKPEWGRKAIYGKKKVLRDLHRMRWWRPQRPEGYSRAIQRFNYASFLPYDHTLLNNPNYMLNPRYKTYTRRVANYAERHPTWKPFRELPNVTQEEEREYWNRIMQEFNREKHTNTPRPIIRYKDLGW